MGSFTCILGRYILVDCHLLSSVLHMYKVRVVLG